MTTSELNILVPEQTKNLSNDRMFVDFLDFVLGNDSYLQQLYNKLRPYRKASKKDLQESADESLEIVDFRYNPYNSNGSMILNYGSGAPKKSAALKNCINVDFEIDQQRGIFRMIFPEQKKKDNQK